MHFFEISAGYGLAPEFIIVAWHTEGYGRSEREGAVEYVVSRGKPEVLPVRLPAMARVPRQYGNRRRRQFASRVLGEYIGYPSRHGQAIGERVFALDVKRLIGALPRFLQKTADTPVVALTAQAMAGDRERFLEGGFDAYISKPVDVPELIRTVRRYCGAEA